MTRTPDWEWDTIIGTIPVSTTSEDVIKRRYLYLISRNVNKTFIFKRELWSLMDLDDSLSLTLSELEEGLCVQYFVGIKFPCLSILCKFQIGIPKITGTSELFDAHPAILTSYNLTIGADQPPHHPDQPPPPLLFSQFEQFLVFIQKYYLLCKVSTNIKESMQ